MKYIRYVLILVVMFTATYFLPVVAQASDSYTVQCRTDKYSSYPQVVQQILPSSHIKTVDSSAFYFLDDGLSVEVFDTQAKDALESGIAEYWYPHYLASIIIAIDRDQTDIIITGWEDMFESQEEVSLLETPTNMHMLLAAMSYGLEGEKYTLTQAIKKLAKLNDKRLLKINSIDSPIIIAYDYQAVDLMIKGRNLEIIVPIEGTFTYEKGLLSNSNLHFEGDVDSLILGSNLRGLNGDASSFYPEKSSYLSAVRISDYKHFIRITENANRLIEREVLKTKKYMSIDHLEHLMFALIFIIIATIWVASFIKRSMQKGVNHAAFFTGIIVNGWMLVRLIKYQVIEIPTLSRYLWYSYYIFQLSLPLVMLWLAWAVDKAENEIFPPKWWNGLAVFISLLILLVYTNDVHGLVFKLDLSQNDWSIYYSYGFGYYLILFVCMANIFVAFMLLVIKSFKNPKRNSFIYPLIIFILFGVYNYLYIVRYPLVYETDVTIVTCLFAILMFEASIRAGLIPVNTKHIELFLKSPLKMQIINNEKELILSSASNNLISQNSFNEVLEASPLPVLQNNHSLLFANPISGGYAIWQEDISELLELRNELEVSSKMLIEANALLAEEEKLKRKSSEQVEKKELIKQLEIEIDQSIKKLTFMIECLADSKDYTKDMMRIAVLLSYIKRRSNLFFQEKESEQTSIITIIDYINEISDILRISNVKIVGINQIKDKISSRYATLFYNFFYEIIDISIQEKCAYIIHYLEEDNESLTMRLLFSEDVGTLEIEAGLLASISKANGIINIKDVDDTIGISLSFTKGGKIND